MRSSSIENDVEQKLCMLKNCIKTKIRGLQPLYFLIRVGFGMRFFQHPGFWIGNVNLRLDRKSWKSSHPGDRYNPGKSRVRIPKILRIGIGIWKPREILKKIPKIWDFYSRDFREIPWVNAKSLKFLTPKFGIFLEFFTFEILQIPGTTQECLILIICLSWYSFTNSFFLF